tara:strand:- start:163 stop:642 length:480 start_codon:yes stop_codon:yes gene_type:complete
MSFLIKFQDYFTFEVIYLWGNLIVLPLWLLLIFLPNSNLSKVLINSITIPLLFSIAYIYVGYQIFLLEIPIYNAFNLYQGIDELYALFADEGFLLIFWLHFLAINLFVGSWIARDGIRNNIVKKIIFLPLVLAYFAGPVGLLLYWIIRMVFARRFSFNE